MLEREQLYQEAKRVLRFGDEEDVAEFLARDISPVEAATISAAFHGVMRDRDG